MPADNAVGKRCSCPTRDLGDGVERREWPDPLCRVHGFPEDRWYAGDPLRVHMRVVDITTGETLTHQEARQRIAPAGEDIDIGQWCRRFRDELPSETVERLMDERRVAA